MSLESFRGEVRSWLETNCPESCRNTALVPGMGWPASPDLPAWRQRMGDRGFSAPTWPKEYGGGGYGPAEARVIAEEMSRIGALPPVAGFGVQMLGPVLLEYANEAQKKDHLPGIVYGRVNWCQGYSEPSSGSDLASLQTRAVRDGDDYVINGQKIWTSGAQNADWIFCLVRTDTEAPKHDGISFILFDVRSPGVTITPIRLISGTSTFCQLFFENVRAKASNLIGKPNAGWTIAKRLLQYERTMLSGGGMAAAASAAPRRGGPAEAGSQIAAMARTYVGEQDGQIAEPALRERIAQLELDQLCLGLSTRRSAETARSTQGPNHTASMFKFYTSELSKRRQELVISILGAQGLGWEGDAFTSAERAATRQWLRSKGATIEGGTSEVQLNVIAKRVLELPD